MSAGRDLAVVELLGVLAYGQLRSFSAMSSAVRHAPDARSADRIATFARREHDAYEAIRGRLGELTDLPEAAMDRQKALFDAFFERAPLGDWFGASVFFAFGIPLARDFARTLVPLLDARSADVLVATLDAREEAEAAAVALLRTQLGDAGSRLRARALVADLLGRALTAFQQGSADTDALRVLFEAGGEAGDRVRGLAMDLLARHRARLVELGLEDVQELADPGDPTSGATGV